MSDKTGKHIQHTLCGHGGEHVIHNSKGNEACNVANDESTTKIIYQYHGRKWNVCTCLPNTTNSNKNRYVTTNTMEKFFKRRLYNVVSV